MGNFRICWQLSPGGRTECTVPMSYETAKLRLREQVNVFPGMRCWLAEEGDAEAAASDENWP